MDGLLQVENIQSLFIKHLIKQKLNKLIHYVKNYCTQ
jgi:hypothetical protein